jgi:hypothetical protein
MVALSPHTCEELADQLHRVTRRSRRGSTVPWCHLTRRRTHSDRSSISRIPGRILTQALVTGVICSHTWDALLAGDAGPVTSETDREAPLGGHGVAETDGKQLHALGGGHSLQSTGLGPDRRADSNAATRTIWVNFDALNCRARMTVEVEACR